MKVNEVVTKLFEIKYIAHLAHLQTNSYSAHKALDEFYTSIEDEIDTFIESYQGEYGIIYGYGSLNPKEGQDIIKLITEVCEIVEKFKSTLENTYLQQILDNILELSYRTKYKLKNLK